MPFNVDDPWTPDDTLRELCNCGAAQGDDPTNPDTHDDTTCAALDATGHPRKAKR